MRIAVIGAGISGLACARSLAAAGCDVTVFEKTGRVGGRASTCHMPWGSFDHGAQYFTARGATFRQLLKHWIDNGIAAAWTGGAPRNDDPFTEGETLYVGTPNMASVGGALAAGLRLQLDSPIGRIAAGTQGWQLDRSDGRVLGTFDWVVSSAPAPLTAELLAAIAPSIAKEATRCRYSPCWAVMARCELWNANGPTLMRPKDSALSWIAHDSSKPGRVVQPTWVLLASAPWSAAHVDVAPDDVARELLEVWARLGAPRVGISSAHRWLHALAEAPLGRPCLIDAERRVGACGDWCIAPRIESAFDSGLALAREIRKLALGAASDEQVGV